MKSRNANRRFGLSLAALCAVLAIAPVVHGSAPRYLPLCLALIVLVLSLLRPHWINPIRLGTNWISERMQMVMSPIFLGLIYFGSFMPGRFLIRTCCRVDLLRLRPDRAADSYWIKRKSSTHPAPGMEDQF